MGNEASVAQGGPLLAHGRPDGPQKCGPPSLLPDGVAAVGGHGGKGGDVLPRLGPNPSTGATAPAGAAAAAAAGAQHSRHAKTVEGLPGVLEVYAHLGSGCFSHVFRCRVVGEDGPVAVKLCTQDQTVVLAREASLLLGLRHTNLVQLRRVIEGPPAALFLELCEGGQLEELLHGKEHLERLRQIGVKARVKAWLEVACAVDYLHSKTIVHRDICSGNCFLSIALQDVAHEVLPALKLGDLSLSRHMDASRLTAGIGSDRYMAPEVMEEEKYGFPVDIYSCGILGHELISGQVPYDSPDRPRWNEVSLILSIATGTRPELEDLPAHPMGKRIKALISTCWDQEPDVRPGAEQLVESLRQLVWNMD